MTPDDPTHLEEINLTTRILVIGSGFTGLMSALEIYKSGYTVTLCDVQKKIDASVKSETAFFNIDASEKTDLNHLKDEVLATSEIDVMSRTSLVSVSGTPGRYQVTLDQSGTLHQLTVGAIVVATRYYANPLNDAYSLPYSDRVISQSELEARLADPLKKEKLLGKSGIKTMAFFVGLAQAGNPVIMERVFRSVIAIGDTSDTQVYVFTDNINVASDNLSRMFLEDRQKGAIYFKVDAIPDIRIDETEMSVNFYAKVIRRDLKVIPDLIVLEEEMVPSPENIKIASALGIDLTPTGYLQSANVHRLPVRTNREGIYIIGPPRGIFNLSWIWADIRNMILELKKMLGDGVKTIDRNQVAHVDRQKCAICLTCYRACPHGAVYWDNKAIISALACQGCGICVAECPMNAIQIPAYTHDRIRAQITDKLPTTSKTPVILAFCCQHSAWEAGQAARDFGYPLPAQLELVKIPCGGNLNVSFVLDAFANGADGVMVLTCHDGNCNSENGNRHALQRTRFLTPLIEGLGLAPERLVFGTLASNMAKEFSEISLDLEARLTAMGRTRIKKTA